MAESIGAVIENVISQLAKAELCEKDSPEAFAALAQNSHVSALCKKPDEVVTTVKELALLYKERLIKNRGMSGAIRPARFFVIDLLEKDHLYSLIMF